MHLKRYFGTLLIAAALSPECVRADVDSPYIPARRPVEFRERLGKENVSLIRTGGERLNSGRFNKEQSLNGTWKFRGLECQETPFGPIGDEELPLMSPELDDSGWSDIKVPLNWWLNPATAYDKVPFQSKPFFRGYYRTRFTIPAEESDRRRILNFDAIGYEADIFVNGRFVCHHHGDFVPCTVDITPFLKTGENLLALRVLADQGPGKDRPFTRTYGARWIPRCIKGGVWHNVTLRESAPCVITEMRLVPQEEEKSVLVRFRVNNPGETVMETEWFGAVQPDEPGAEPPPAAALGRIALPPGESEHTVRIPCGGDVKRWSIDDPNLYYVVLYAEAAGEIAALRQERTGFRTMKVKGTGFEFNGKPIYPIGESSHSSSHGGMDFDVVANFRTLLTLHKENGVMLLRTAHMPMIPEFYDVADEIGMMVYDEWGNSFVNDIDPVAFEKNNLPELRRFILRDHNHPSVVLWSLGNENKHGPHPEISEQLDKQYMLCKELDLQNRPACAFSGVANVDAYGRTKLKTDFLDIHHYQGMIDSSWAKWDPNFGAYVKWNTEVYGKDGKLELPIVMWECVGAGWGHRYDPSVKPGDPGEYLKRMSEKMSWGLPGPDGYSGAVGLYAAIDPARGKYYTETYLATRLCELFRQDERLAGFGPWFSDPRVPEVPRWNQPVLGGLRLNDRKDGRLMARQLARPSTRQLQCFVLNQSSDPLDDVQVTVHLRTDRERVPVAEAKFGTVPAVSRAVRDIELTLPDGPSSQGELQLTVTAGGREIGRNGYAVTLHRADEIAVPAVSAQKVGVIGNNPALTEALKQLSIPAEPASLQNLASFRCVILAPGAEKLPDAALRSYVENGGLLLILEPPAGALPGFPDFTVKELGNHLAELVVPSHPVFAGLTQADFDTWAEMPYGESISRGIDPATVGVLAMKPIYVMRKTPLMGIAEHTCGKGRLLVSTLNTLPLWGVNPAATRYLRNLLVYASCDDAKPAAPPLLETKPLAFRTNPEKLFSLDLRKWMNRAFRDEKADDRQGGWTDQGENDFRMMPTGRQTFAEIPFDIVDPAQNNNKSCIVLRGRGGRDLPESAPGIPVNQKIAALYLLHTAAWATNTGCATYRLNYEDGGKFDYELLCGRDIADWWNPVNLSNAIVVCRMRNAVGGDVGWYVSRILNPYPSRKVKSVDIYADGYANRDVDFIMPNGANLIVGAITAELAHPDPLEILTASANPLKVRSTTELLRPGEQNAVQAELCGNTAKDKRIKINFPEIRGDRRPVAIVFFDPAKLQKNSYRFFTFTYRSDGQRRIQLRISEKSNKLGLLYSFDLGNSAGQPVTVRLDLRQDFTLMNGKEFPLSDARGEILFCDDAPKVSGELRPPVSFEILEMYFE